MNAQKMNAIEDGLLVNNCPENMLSEYQEEIYNIMQSSTLEMLLELSSDKDNNNNNNNNNDILFPNKEMIEIDFKHRNARLQQGMHNNKK